MSSRTDAKSKVEVHVARWFKGYKARSVESVSVSSDSAFCAVGRSDGSIEIWDLRGSFIERVIPGVGLSTVKSVCLLEYGSGESKRYLVLCSGLHGWIYAWDCESLSLLAKMHSASVWNLAVQRSAATLSRDGLFHEWLCAAACDDGNLRLWKVRVPLQIHDLSTLHSAECARIDLWQTLSVSASGVSAPRCLSVCWSPSGRRVFAGTSDGVIGGFELQQVAVSGELTISMPRELGRIRAVRRSLDSKSAKSAAGSRFRCCLWSLTCLSEALVASGTSFGTVDVYRVKNGTLAESLSVSRGDAHADGCDVLCIDASVSSGVLVAATMDGRIVQCTHNARGIGTGNGKQLLVCTGYHSRHSGSDALAVCCSHSVAVSGAIDGTLAVCATRDFFRHWLLNPFSSAFQNCSDRNNRWLSVSRTSDGLSPAWLRGVIPDESVDNDTFKSLVKKKKGKMKLEESSKKEELMSGQIVVSRKGHCVNVWRAIDGVQLLCIALTTVDDDGSTPLLAFDVSDCGQFVACATLSETWIFSIHSENVAVVSAEENDEVKGEDKGDVKGEGKEEGKEELKKESTEELMTEMSAADAKRKKKFLKWKRKVAAKKTKGPKLKAVCVFHAHIGAAVLQFALVPSLSDATRKLRLYLAPLRSDGIGELKRLSKAAKAKKTVPKLAFVALDNLEFAMKAKAKTTSGSLDLDTDTTTAKESLKNFGLSSLTLTALEVSDSELLSEGVSWKNELVTALTVSSDGTLLAVNIASLRRALVFEAFSGQCVYVCPKGAEKSTVSCVRFQEIKKGRNEVWVIYSNNALKVWCLRRDAVAAVAKRTSGGMAKKRMALSSSLHPWCHRNAKAWNSHNRSSSFALTALTFNGGMTHKPLLGRADYLLPLSLKEDIALYKGHSHSSHSRKRKFSELKADSSGSRLKVIHNYDTCLLATYVDTNVLFVMHRPKAVVYDKSTRAIYRKRYGI